MKLNVEGKLISSVYIGGSLFLENKHSRLNYKILAQYAELPGEPVAIITGEYGQGCWLLSSTHPEYDQEALDLINFNVVNIENSST